MRKLSTYFVCGENARMPCVSGEPRSQEFNVTQPLLFSVLQKKRKQGFTLLELTVALAIITIMITATLTTVDSIRVEKALSVGAELRTLHLTQKHFLIQSLDHPGSIDLTSLTLTQLQNSGLAPNTLPAIEKAGITTIRVNQMPPICSLDGSQKDELKTGKNSGDLLYDIGRE